MYVIDLLILFHIASEVKLCVLQQCSKDIEIEYLFTLYRSRINGITICHLTNIPLILIYESMFNRWIEYMHKQSILFSTPH